MHPISIYNRSIKISKFFVFYIPAVLIIDPTWSNFQFSSMNKLRRHIKGSGVQICRKFHYPVSQGRGHAHLYFFSSFLLIKYPSKPMKHPVHLSQKRRETFLRHCLIDRSAPFEGTCQSICQSDVTGTNADDLPINSHFDRCIAYSRCRKVSPH